MVYFFCGFLIIAGVAGGLDNAPDSDLMYLALAAVAGFVLMIVGINKINPKWLTE